MDDIILAGNSMDEIDRLKTKLYVEFKIKYFGKLKYFIRVEVSHSKIEIIICQRKYFLNLLKNTCLLESKPVKTHIDPSFNLYQDTNKPFEDILNYRRLDGKLLYLLPTRSDNSFKYIK